MLSGKNYTAFDSGLIFSIPFLIPQVHYVALNFRIGILRLHFRLCRKFRHRSRHLPCGIAVFRWKFVDGRKFKIVAFRFGFHLTLEIVPAGFQFRFPRRIAGNLPGDSGLFHRLVFWRRLFRRLFFRARFKINFFFFRVNR